MQSDNDAGLITVCSVWLHALSSFMSRHASFCHDDACCLGTAVGPSIYASCSFHGGLSAKWASIATKWRHMQVTRCQQWTGESVEHGEMQSNQVSMIPASLLVHSWILDAGLALAPHGTLNSITGFAAAIVSISIGTAVVKVCDRLLLIAPSAELDGCFRG